MVKKREEHLPEDHPALVIFDNFTAQCIEDFFKLLESHHVSYALVPANCTGRIQPLDLTVDKPTKNFLRNKFQGWYSEQVATKWRVFITLKHKIRISDPGGSALNRLSFDST